ncbi:E3 ubiquitin protein ligase-like protein isoform X1 [Tanacetum coccineum]
MYNAKGCLDTIYTEHTGSVLGYWIHGLIFFERYNQIRLMVIILAVNFETSNPSPHVTEQFHTQPVQQPPYEPTITDQTSYIARIVPDTVLSDRCEKFSRQPGSVASTGYTMEKLKIVTKCSHHFPVGCIYEWMEISEHCCVCGKDGSADSDGNSNYVIEPLQLLETIVQELYARGGSRRRKVGVSDLNEPLPVENLEHLAVVALSVGSRIPVVHDGPEVQ